MSACPSVQCCPIDPFAYTADASPVVYYNTEQSYTAVCPFGYSGDSVTVTKAAGTFSSQTSQNAADTDALAAATAEATAALVCTAIPT